MLKEILQPDLRIFFYYFWLDRKLAKIKQLKVLKRQDTREYLNEDRMREFYKKPIRDDNLYSSVSNEEVAMKDHSLCKGKKFTNTDVFRKVLRQLVVNLPKNKFKCTNLNQGNSALILFIQIWILLQTFNTLQTC